MLAQPIRAAIVETAQRLQRLGLLSLTAGNLSVRVEGELMAITPTGMPYEQIEPQDIVITDLAGNVVDGSRRPSSELPFHSAVLRARSDVGAVVHTHSLYATTLAVLGRTIPAVHYVIAALDLETVPLVPYATFGSDELASGIAAAIGNGGKAALLANHGALALGDDLADAARSAELLEFLATVYHRALAVGEPVVLPSAEIARVGDRYGDYGQPPAGPADDPSATVAGR
jgi:L-fuculose-phosphate aldolase